MPRPLTCQFCRAELDPAREFAYHVETLTPEGPVLPAALRRLPAVAGKPVRACRGCRVVPVRRSADAAGSAILAAVAVAGLWAITAKLSTFLSDGPA